jgi:hypothetical protein
MRGIGKGQTIRLFIVPEIMKLILAAVSAGVGISEASARQELDTLAPPDISQQLLKHVCAWLFINGMRSEKTQFNLLCEQNVCNVWRKAAYRHLMGSHVKIGTEGCDTHTQACLDVFRERVDFDVDNTIPPEQSFAGTYVLSTHTRPRLCRGFYALSAVRVAYVQARLRSSLMRT